MADGGAAVVHRGWSDEELKMESGGRRRETHDEQQKKRVEDGGMEGWR